MFKRVTIGKRIYLLLLIMTIFISAAILAFLHITENEESWPDCG
ncbi:hypothetical protein [Desulfocurvibacter africanus]|nr:hypothetical protein [Desulfocurvibacter africanus]